MAIKFITSQPHDMCPNKLYKYIGNIDYVFDAIENNTIYFPLSDTFNDPFDCKIINDGLLLDLDYNGDKEIILPMINVILLNCSGFFVSFFRDGKDYDLMEKTFLKKTEGRENIAPSEYLQFVYDYAEYNGTYSDFYNCIKQSYIVNQPIVSLCRRVTCFSECNDSIPMWAYYADNNNGVCLEYTPELLKDRDVCKSIQKVNYTKEQCNNLKKIKHPTDLNAFLFNKSLCWKHEKEWRIVLKDNVERIAFPCLSGIYLGVNFRKKYGNKDTFRRIMNAIRDSQNEILLYEAFPNNDHYKLDFRKI